MTPTSSRCDAPPVHPAVRQLQEALTAVTRAQLDGSLAAGSLVDTAELVRCAERSAGLALVEVAAVDRHQSYVQVGCQSTAGWVGAVLTLDDQAARTKVRLSHRLTRDLEPVGQLLVDGGTTVSHCQAMAGGLRGVDPAVVEESLPALVVLAQELDPPSLSRELRERAHAVSDELGEQQERRQRERRGLRISELLDGCGKVDGVLTPEQLQIVNAALDAKVHGEREAGDLRDAPARRVDALVDLARHALDCAGASVPQQGGVRAQVTVLCTLETLEGEPGSTPATFPGTAALLTRQQLLRLSCDADISRLVLSTDGVVLDLGRSTRTVTSAQWRALVARDRGCVVSGCRRRPSQTQAHHVRHWVLGGPSDLDNYALVCHLHHHELHEGRRRLQHRDGRWLTPEGYEPASPPLFDG